MEVKFTCQPSLLPFFSICFPQNPRKQIFGAEFCVTSITQQGEFYRLIYSVSLKCAKGTQVYSAAYALWCFTSGASLISD